MVGPGLVAALTGIARITVDRCVCLVVRRNTMTDEKPDNLIDLITSGRMPADLSPTEALVYIHTLVENVSHQSDKHRVDLTLDAVRKIIAKALKSPRHRH